MTESGKRKVCHVCGDFAEVMHHTSYSPEETVPLCRECHDLVHSDEQWRPELVPDEERPNEDELEYAPMIDSEASQMTIGDYNDVSSKALTCNCGTVTEEGDVSISEVGLATCPECGQNLKRGGSILVADKSRWVLDYH